MQPSPDRPESSVAPVEQTRSGSTAEVSALLAGLETLDARPLDEHVEVFEQVHGRLQAALREIDNA